MCEYHTAVSLSAPIDTLTRFLDMTCLKGCDPGSFCEVSSSTGVKIEHQLRSLHSLIALSDGDLTSCVSSPLWRHSDGSVMRKHLFT